MKKLFVLLLLVLALGAWVGEKMVQDPGYVLLAYNESTLETSLWVLLLALFIGFLVLHWLLNLFFQTRLPTDKIRRWRARRRSEQARGKTLKGLLAFSEGRWWKAQRLLDQSADGAEQPLVNYLLAAKAAHEQQDTAGADRLLQQARTAVPQAELAIGITQAQMQLERGQPEPALATLLHLRSVAPKHTLVLRLLKDAYIHLHDWAALTELLPALRKYNVMNEQDIAELEQRCYGNLLTQSVSRLPAGADAQARVQALTHEWQRLPSAVSQQQSLALNYAEQLLAAGSPDQAEQFLRTRLSKHWDERLVRLYGQVESTDVHKQLDVAKGWQKKHAESAALKLTLARLSMYNQHWGKAVDYLEESLALQPSAEAYAELSRLLQHLGEEERSLAVMQQSMALLGNTLPPLKTEKPTPG